MKTYTAREMTEILKNEGDTDITLRTVRYYAQRDMLPQRDLNGGKLVYTDDHLNHLRMLRAMKKTGKKLDNIKGSLETMTTESIRQLNQTHYDFIQELSDNFVEKSIEKINDDIHLLFSAHVKEETKQAIVQLTKTILKEKGE